MKNGLSLVLSTVIQSFFFAPQIPEMPYSLGNNRDGGLDRV